MKKIISLLFIPVLIFSMIIPAFGKTGGGSEKTYGSKIGWNYAIISKSGSGWKAAKPDKTNDESSHVSVSEGTTV